MSLFDRPPKTFDPGEWVPMGVEPDPGGAPTWYASFTRESAPKGMIVFSSAAATSGWKLLVTWMICEDIKYPYSTMEWEEVRTVLADSDFEYTSSVMQTAQSAAVAITFGRGEGLPGIGGLHEKITQIFTWDGESRWAPGETGGA